MRFRTGVLLGAAVGYVMGARAGRERYEQIKRFAGELRKHPAVAQLSSQVQGVSDASRKAVAAGLDQSAEALRKLG
ncbi:MAG TPA: YtxH domain-containing protein [Acidimicrobiia bacterium]|jgi:hypothetical protein